MGELIGIYALWYRELKVFLRERSRIISSIVTPLLWIVVFGGGLGSAINIGGVGYQAYIFPGVIMLSVLFSSIFFGLYIVWDKKVDFFKEVMVAPLSRTTLFVGKMLGGCTDALIQGAILMAVGPLFGIVYTPLSILVLIAFILIVAASMSSLGLAVGAQMTSFEGFGLVSSFVVFPLFFLSGALYPLDNLPAWLQALTYVNPLTYVVDGMRGVLLGVNHFPLYMDFGIPLAFMLALIGAGTLSFMKMTA